MDEKVLAAQNSTINVNCTLFKIILAPKFVPVGDRTRFGGTTIDPNESIRALHLAIFAVPDWVLWQFKILPAVSVLLFFSILSRSLFKRGLYTRLSE